MDENKPTINLRTGIIIIVIISSITLYLAGVFSGLIANNLVKKETKQDIESFKQETEQYLGELEDYILFLDTNLKNMQLEETFLQTLSREDKCSFTEISFNELVSQLGYYWSRLPSRIEEYEKNNKPSPEYTRLKEQYTHLSIRTWILAKNQFEKCNIDLVHGLHFYSVDCEECVAQGEQLDKLNIKVKSKGKDIILFPIDFNSEDPIIKNLKKFYSIKTTPAVIINDKIHQGRLFTSEELLPENLNSE